MTILDELIGITEEDINRMKLLSDEELAKMYEPYLPMIREPRKGRKEKPVRVGVVEAQDPAKVKRKLAEDELRAMCPELFI